MHRTKLICGVTLVMLGIPLAAAAAEWSAKPQVKLTTGYDSNIRMTASRHDAVWESSLAPSIKLGVATETQGLTTDAGFAVRRFTGGSGNESGSLLNREDYHLNANAFHNSETTSLRFNVDYTRDSTLDSELDQGIISGIRVTRNYLAAGPSWYVMLTPLTRVDASYTASNIRYENDNNSTSNLVDYDYHTASGSLSYRLTPRTQGLLAAGYTRYQPDSNFESSSLSLQAGAETAISETLTVSVRAGQRRTVSDTTVATGFCIGADPGAVFPGCTGGITYPTGLTTTPVSSAAAVYSASVTKTLETGSLSASLTRSSSPSSTGELLDAIRLQITGEQRFSETLRSYLKLEYAQNDTIASRTGQQGVDKRTYFRITPRVSWQWQQEWSLSGEYRFASIDRGNNDTANSNSVFFTLRYQPLKLSISR